MNASVSAAPVVVELPPGEAELAQKQLAQWLGLTARQIHNLVAEGMPAPVRNGRRVYPWPAALRWYIDYRVRAEVKRGTGGDDAAALRRREAAARADRAETDAELGRL